MLHLLPNCDIHRSDHFVPRDNFSWIDILFYRGHQAPHCTGPWRSNLLDSPILKKYGYRRICTTWAPEHHTQQKMQVDSTQILSWLTSICLIDFKSPLLYLNIFAQPFLMQYCRVKSTCIFCWVLKNWHWLSDMPVAPILMLAFYHPNYKVLRDLLLQLLLFSLRSSLHSWVLEHSWHWCSWSFHSRR